MIPFRLPHSAAGPLRYLPRVTRFNAGRVLFRWGRTACRAQQPWASHKTMSSILAPNKLRCKLGLLRRAGMIQQCRRIAAGGSGVLDHRRPVCMPPPSRRMQHLGLLQSKVSGYIRPVGCTRLLSTGQEKAPSAVQATSKAQEASDSQQAEKKLTWREKLQERMAKHGIVFVLYWNTVWLATGVGTYCMLEYGGVDSVELARSVYLDRIVDVNRINPSLGNVAVAAALNEGLEVIRLPIVLATVPYVTRLWERIRPAWTRIDGGENLGFWRTMWTHGPVFVVYWGSLWLAGAVGFYGMLEGHLLGDVDGMALAYKLGLDQFFDLDSLDPRYGNAIAAVLFNEVSELWRLPLAIATVPFVTRWLRAKRLPKP